MKSSFLVELFHKYFNYILLFSPYGGAAVHLQTEYWVDTQIQISEEIFCKTDFK